MTVPNIEKLTEKTIREIGKKTFHPIDLTLEEMSSGWRVKVGNRGGSKKTVATRLTKVEAEELARGVERASDYKFGEIVRLPQRRSRRSTTQRKINRSVGGR